MQVFIQPAVTSLIFIYLPVPLYIILDIVDPTCFDGMHDQF